MTNRRDVRQFVEEIFQQESDLGLLAPSSRVREDTGKSLNEVKKRHREERSSQVTRKIRNYAVVDLVNRFPMSSIVIECN